MSAGSCSSCLCRGRFVALLISVTHKGGDPEGVAEAWQFSAQGCSLLGTDIQGLGRTGCQCPARQMSLSNTAPLSDNRQRGPFFLLMWETLSRHLGIFPASLPAAHNNPFSSFLPHRCAAVMCLGRESLYGFSSDTNWVLLLREVDLGTCRA